MYLRNTLQTIHCFALYNFIILLKIKVAITFFNYTKILHFEHYTLIICIFKHILIKIN